MVRWRAFIMPFMASALPLDHDVLQCKSSSCALCPPIQIFNKRSPVLKYITRWRGRWMYLLVGCLVPAVENCLPSIFSYNHGVLHTLRCSGCFSGSEDICKRKFVAALLPYQNGWSFRFPSQLLSIYVTRTPHTTRHSPILIALYFAHLGPITPMVLRY